jgi:tetratricopeptide (TPR) repeat protein
MLHNLALLLLTCQANDYFTEALAIEESANGGGANENACIIKAWLATILQDMGELEEAEMKLRKVLDELEKMDLLRDHPSIATATVVRKLARVLKEKGKLTEAVEEYRRSFAIFVKIHGDKHPETQFARQALAAAERGATTEMIGAELNPGPFKSVFPKAVHPVLSRQEQKPFIAQNEERQAVVIKEDTRAAALVERHEIIEGSL